MNTQDTDFRAVSDRWPVFALAQDLGAVTSATDPVVVAIGHVRDPAVEYIVANGGVQNRSLLFWTQFSNIADAVRGRRP